MSKNILSIALVLIAANFAAAKTPDAPNLTDAQIGKVLITINQGEIDAADIAKSKAQNGAVKDYAKMMITEHKKNEDETKKLTKKFKGDEDSDLAKSLKEDAKTSNKDLKKNEKDMFDKAYIDQQVVMHEKALATLNDTLIPNVTDADLKSHLQKTHAAVAHHLDQAKKLQTH